MESLQIEKMGGAVVVSLSGELTLELTERIKKEMEEVLDREWNILAMEVSGIEFMDSSGIGFLVATNNKTKQAGREFYLYRPSPQVVKTLKLVNLYGFFRVINSEEELRAAAA